jgi:hypothetical protein
MPTHRSLTGVAHDIAHHAASGLSFLSPHMAQAVRASGRDTAAVELLADRPYPAGVVESEALRRALASLRATTVSILGKYGFGLEDVTSIQLQATRAPWDAGGYLLHTRTVITDAEGRAYDSGWLPK